MSIVSASCLRTRLQLYLLLARQPAFTALLVHCCQVQSCSLLCASPPNLVMILALAPSVMLQLEVKQDGHTGDILYRVLARGPEAKPAGDEAALADFFNLSMSLQQLSKQWAADPRFRAVHPFFPGQACKPCAARVCMYACMHAHQPLHEALRLLQAVRACASGFVVAVSQHGHCRTNVAFSLRASIVIIRLAQSCPVAVHTGCTMLVQVAQLLCTVCSVQAPFWQLQMTRHIH